MQAISEDGCLKGGLTEVAAVDLLWTLLSVENWERLVVECGWSQSDYEQALKQISEATLISRKSRYTLNLSRFSAAPSARLSHFPFESDGAFPAQC